MTSVDEDALASANSTRPALAARVLSLLNADYRTGRLVIGIAGPPGSGKTTVADELAERVSDLGEPAVVLPMDGFHLANTTLMRLDRQNRKGAIDTFDGWGFLHLLRRLHTEQDHCIYAPGFDRTTDQAVAGTWAIQPEHRVVIVEGNYLLATVSPWDQVAAELDEIWYCHTPDAVRHQRLVERHVSGGRSHAAATAWARDVDGVNATLVESTRHRARLCIPGMAT